MIVEADFNWENIEIGCYKYDFIMNRFLRTDVSKDEEFQKKFTGFYRIRRSKELFLKKYYCLMESLKGKSVNFELIIREVNKFIGSIEPSFSSKMLATLDPNMPVWDKFVLTNAKINPPLGVRVNIENCVETFNEIIKFYESFLGTSDAREMLELFDNKLPTFRHFTKIKKIDLMFWQKR